MDLQYRYANYLKSFKYNNLAEATYSSRKCLILYNTTQDYDNLVKEFSFDNIRPVNNKKKYFRYASDRWDKKEESSYERDYPFCVIDSAHSYVHIEMCNCLIVISYMSSFRLEKGDIDRVYFYKDNYFAKDLISSNRALHHINIGTSREEIIFWYTLPRKVVDSDQEDDDEEDPDDNDDHNDEYDEEDEDEDDDHNDEYEVDGEDDGEDDEEDDDDQEQDDGEDDGEDEPSFSNITADYLTECVKNDFPFYNVKVVIITSEPIYREDGFKKDRYTDFYDIDQSDNEITIFGFSVYRELYK
jgi:hypothetical protein